MTLLAFVGKNGAGDFWDNQGVYSRNAFWTEMLTAVRGKHNMHKMDTRVMARACWCTFNIFETQRIIRGEHHSGVLFAPLVCPQTPVSMLSSHI